MRLKRFDGNPVLSPVEGSAWRSLVVTNPGAYYDAERREVLMLYRAAGDDVEHRVHLGLAVSRDGYRFEFDSDAPVFSPSEPGFDGGCVEDPRIMKIGAWFYVTYASRPFPPGQYWKAKRPAFGVPQFGPDAPWHLRHNATTTYLAMTQDFKTWVRAGRLTDPRVDDRDVYFFPEKINGKYWMIHRPMNWTGPAYGTDHPAMWISSGDDLLACRDRPTLLATAVFDWEKKVGGNTPPLRTPLGWLTLYHAVGPDKRYRLGALILDPADPTRVTHRTRDWLLQPEQPYEIEGFYPGVCFPCGKVVIDDTLFVYYGGADRYVGVATCALSELLSYLADCPVRT